MATSGTYSFSVNRDQIIRMAMLFIGKLDETEVPTAQEVIDCALVLNMLVKQWQGRGDFAPGLKVWTRRRGHLMLSYTTGQYSVGPTAIGWTTGLLPSTVAVNAVGGSGSLTVVNAAGMTAGMNIGIELDAGPLFWTTLTGNPVGNVCGLAQSLPSSSSAGSMVYAYQTAAQQPLKIEAAVLRDNQNNDTPLRILEQADYDFLPAKVSQTNISDPTAIYYEFQLGNSILFTDVAAAADVSKRIVLTYLESLQDFNNPLDTPEYPQEWFLALCWGLAEQIAPMFSVTWNQGLAATAGKALAIAQRKDPERVTLFFQPGEDGT